MHEFVDIIIRSDDDASIFDTMRRMRLLRNVPDVQADHGGLLWMRNGVDLPTIGLGTGGIGKFAMQPTITKALQMGYRLLDLAREYENEEDVREIFRATAQDDVTPAPYEVFLLTKVWPTELGFIPTSNAIMQSRVSLRVAAINNYMLHWPACNPNIQWMHCETTTDPHATWHQSYRALEKAYSEGDILSIGISNFNEHLLHEISQHAAVLPHLLQNYATIGSIDRTVLEWCKRYHVLFQPYAPVRNVRDLTPKVFEIIANIARKHGQTIHAVIYRYFVQLGATIIPRSTKIEHLKQNLNVLHWQLTEEDMQQLDSLKA